MKKLIIVAIIAITAWSCEDLTKYTRHIKSYVMGYYTYDNVQINVNSNNDILVCPEIGNICREDSESEEDKALFNELSTKYNDTHYYLTVSSNSPTAFLENPMAVHNIESIDLICAEEIDTQYPEGSSVSDLVIFTTYSPLLFIQTGYNIDFDQTGEYKYMEGLLPCFCYDEIIKPLNEITSDDLVMIGNGAVENNLLFYLSVADYANSPLKDKKLKLTLHFADRPSITKEFTFSQGIY